MLIYNKQFVIQYELQSKKNIYLFFLHSSNTNTINTNPEALLADCKEIGLEVNAERNGRVFVPGRECGAEP
jgi:hypothetical protein